MNESSQFRIVSYNLRDFDEPVVGNKAHSRKLKELKNTIDSLDAGFIGFQEACSEDALHTLNRNLNEPFPWCSLVVGNSTRRQHIGYFSKYPVTTTSHADARLIDCDDTHLTHRVSTAVTGADDAASYQTQSVRFQRDLVLADINSPGGRFALFIAHLKSMRSDSDKAFPDNPGQDRIRRAEANTIRLIVQRYQRDNPQTPIVILGDLNATHEMTSLQPLLANSDFLDAVQRDWIDGGNHPSYSYRKPPARARLDYLLLSQQAQHLYQPNSARIHRVRGWKTASDHLPVSIALRLNRNQPDADRLKRGK